MSPPDDQRRPGGGGVDEVVETDPSVAHAGDETVHIAGVAHLNDYRGRSYRRPEPGEPQHCVHGRDRQRFCDACVRYRRRVTATADRFVGKGGVVVVGPATFGLHDEELRLEARRLWAAGWTTEEITAVLEVEPLAGASR